MYGTDTPLPGKLTPRYGSTARIHQLANAASGRDLQWFFDVYMYQNDLPELVVTPGRQYLDHALEDGKEHPLPDAGRSARG